MLEDRTNEKISLSLHQPLYHGYGNYSDAELVVDVDSDSSYEPPQWVFIDWSDRAHDSDTIKLTAEEAGLLHDRLGLILGRS
uniref:Uncharacterized protein n=1 Tax=Micrococcus phage Kurnik TaxID=3092208 RepID=A0AAU6R655_9CAUD